MHNLAIEGLFTVGEPDPLVDQISNTQAFTATPDAGGVVECQLLFGGLGVASLLRFKGGKNHSRTLLKIHFLEFPSIARAQAVAWLVFKEDIKLAGSIDMIYKKPDGTLAIYDWKRAKEIKFENRYQKMTGPLNHLPDTNYWHYSLQLNIYRRILEELYHVTVSELALVVLHPNQTTYKVVRLNMMDEEVEAMMATRRLP